MKTSALSLLALAGAAAAHYTLPELIVGGKGTGAWQYVRQTANYQSNGIPPGAHTQPPPND